MSNDELLEISDLIVDYDVATLQRRPVDKSAVIAKLRTAGDLKAAHIVDAMPADNGVLDSDYVDRLLVRVHCEMQRLSEEFQHGRRVLELITPMLTALKNGGAPAPYRIVDIGSGTGFVIRWLAAHGNLGPDVQLMGVDLNHALMAEARRLAERERLACRFEVANAFALDQPATLFLSTGVVHHFRGEGLTEFFQQHDRANARAFAHFDFQPNFFARPGAWLFHYIRMREPLSQHDGVISARRAFGSDLARIGSANVLRVCDVQHARVELADSTCLPHAPGHAARTRPGVSRRPRFARANRLEALQ